MNFSTKHIKTIIFLLIILVILFVLDISFGSVKIPFNEVLNSFFISENSVNKIIIQNYRLPKATTAIFAGVGLSVSGLLMQTLFRNPLAGPYVLGISSGASLGVALVILGSSILPIYFQSIFQSNIGVVFGAILGSFLVLLLVIFIAQKLKDTMLVLIVGIMFGSFTNALVSLLSYFSKAEELQKYIVWNMGSLANLSGQTILVLSILIIVGFGTSLHISKTLNSLLLGENYAQSIGILFKKERLKIILITGVLTGSITAFVGPIAFVGLAVPHLAKLILKTSNHFVLVVGSSFLGAIVLLLCDFLSQNIFENTLIPINVLTSLLGAPMVFYIIFNKQKIKF